MKVAILTYVRIREEIILTGMERGAVIDFNRQN